VPDLFVGGSFPMTAMVAASISRTARSLSKPSSGSPPPDPEASVTDLPEDVRRWAAMADEEAEQCVWRLLQRGMSAEEVCLDVLTTAARKLGDLWNQDRCTFVDVTLAVTRFQNITHRLGPHFNNTAEPGSRGRALVGTVPGEQHTFGLSMVAEFLKRDGWEVVLADAARDTAAFVAPLADSWFDIVAISAANDRAEQGLRRLLSSVRRRGRNHQVRAIIGGRLVQDRDGLVDRVGADGWAEDARAAVLLARTLGQAHPRPRTRKSRVGGHS
jgi:MerR family transcriptional regulator, light-induced transcriptional regulator